MLFIISVLPVILIGLYIYKKDKVKESSGLLFKLFFCGICSCFPAVFLGNISGLFFPAIEDMSTVQLCLYLFLTVALCEELCKWVFLYIVSYNHREFDTNYDMIVYASFVALGFACLENILYVTGSGFVVGLLRAVTAVPGHVCDGVLMGYYLSLAKRNQINGNFAEASKCKWLSIIVPTITHSIYDILLFVSNPIFFILFIIYIITLFVICFRKIKDISKNSFESVKKSHFCSACGNLVDTNYCAKCGHRNIEFEI